MVGDQYSRGGGVVMKRPTGAIHHLHVPGGVLAFDGRRPGDDVEPSDDDGGSIHPSSWTGNLEVTMTLKTEESGRFCSILESLFVSLVWHHMFESFWEVIEDNTIRSSSFALGSHTRWPKELLTFRLSPWHSAHICKSLGT